VAAISKLFKTTTFRLSMSYFALFTTAAALAIGYIYWNTNVLFARQLEQTIQAEIQGLAEQYRQGGIKLLTATIAERSQNPGNSLYLVTDRQGRGIAGNLKSVSRKLWDTVGRVEFGYRRPVDSGKVSRLAFASIFRLPEGYRLIVGRDIEDRRLFSEIVKSALIWGFSFMAFVSVIGGWLVSRNLLSRIDIVTATSRTIMGGDLSERIPLTGSNDELDRLSINLNEMLDRIEQLMLGLKEVSDNIAHDLKTPLNRLRNRVESALRETDGSKSANKIIYQRTLEQTIEDADELIRTFNSLLSIARLEAGAAGDFVEIINVTTVVQSVIELYEPVAEEYNIGITHKFEDNPTIKADRQLLGQAIANLIDNAIKYSGKKVAEPNIQDRPDIFDSHIDIGVKLGNGLVQISVSDNGPGIPIEDRLRVVKRFVRLEKSRSQTGSGLGLSLVAAVTNLYSGSLSLEDNQPGLRAVLSFPQFERHLKDEKKSGRKRGSLMGADVLQLQKFSEKAFGKNY